MRTNIKLLMTYITLSNRPGLFLHRKLALCLASCLLVGCATQPTAGPQAEFQHEISEGPKPWTTGSVRLDPGAVRFAVFSDLTGGERHGVFDLAIAQLNLLRPELIVNVGDLIEGSTDRAELESQWAEFGMRAGKARAPVFFTGGNHDLLSEELREAWIDRIGPRYYHFRYRDVLFLVLDTEDHSVTRLREIAQLRAEALEVLAEQGYEAVAKTAYARLPEDETGMISSEQAEHMTRALEENPDVRWTFLLMHKAPWTGASMASWQDIERALGDRPYTVFHGHRHSYKHEVRDGRDYIRLATTGGSFAPLAEVAFDHVVWVTVDEEGAHIANLKLSGILDKTGTLPGDSEQYCLQWDHCGDE